MRSLSVVTLGISHFAAALFSRALCTDREAFAAYELLEPAQQVTAQTARTLVQGDDAGLVRPQTVLRSASRRAADSTATFSLPTIGATCI